MKYQNSLTIFAILLLLLTQCLAVTYFPKCSSIYSSLKDALASYGEGYDLVNKTKAIAELNGYSNYSGSVEENTALLNLLKSGKLIKNISESTSITHLEPTPSTTTMINRLKQSLSDSSQMDTLVNMGTVLLNSGYEPAFVAGILGNMIHQGSNIGKFESSNYPPLGFNPKKGGLTAEPSYLRYMDNNYDYRNKYSGKSITDVSLRELSKLMVKLADSNWEKGKFGLGCMKWYEERAKALVNLYVIYANGKDNITLEQATKAEGKMILNELKGAYKIIYDEWKNEHSDNLNNKVAAFDAAYMLCTFCEVIAESFNHGVSRGYQARRFFNIMMGK